MMLTVNINIAKINWKSVGIKNVQISNVGSLLGGSKIQWMCAIGANFSSVLSFFFPQLGFLIQTRCGWASAEVIGWKTTAVGWISFFLFFSFWSQICFHVFLQKEFGEGGRAWDCIKSQHWKVWTHSWLGLHFRDLQNLFI